ncbi:MAG: hypothetical protein ACPGO5_00545 [Patescibacteria group bacterium]
MQKKILRELPQGTKVRGRNGRVGSYSNVVLVDHDFHVPYSAAQEFRTVEKFFAAHIKPRFKGRKRVRKKDLPYGTWHIMQKKDNTSTTFVITVSVLDYEKGFSVFSVTISEA